MTDLTQRTIATNTRRNTRIAFGLYDSTKAEGFREIGTYVWTYEVRFAVDPDRLGCGYRCAPGNYFAFNTQGTRNGVSYGPGQNERLFDTAEARDKAAKKYLKNARKGAEKRAAKFEQPK